MSNSDAFLVYVLKAKKDGQPHGFIPFFSGLFHLLRQTEEHVAPKGQHFVYLGGQMYGVV
jgi:hypothetical protein